MRLLGLLLIVALPSPAAAQDEVPPPPPDVPPPPPTYDPAAQPPPPPPAATRPAGPRPGVRTHDGFHLRMGAGLGLISINRVGTNSMDDLERETQIANGAFGLEFTLGGTVGPVVLGGLIHVYAAGGAEIEEEDGTRTPINGNFNVLLMGFVADWYPSVTGGFHLSGALGFMAASGKLPREHWAVERGIEQIGGAGFGFALGAGYDFWISDQWSMGPQLRCTFGRVSGEGDLRLSSGEIVRVREDDGVFTALLAFVATLH